MLYIGLSLQWAQLHGILRMSGTAGYPPLLGVHMRPSLGDMDEDLSLV